MAIPPVVALQTPVTTEVAPKPAESSGGGFGDALKQLLSSVEGATSSANGAVTNMLGGTGDVHEAMIALHRAEMTLQLTVQVRNKLVAAYQDIMRMPI